MTDFIFWGSKITVDGECSHEIKKKQKQNKTKKKKRLLLGRKATTNLESILKSRDVTLPTKVHLVKAMVFPVVRYGCEKRKREVKSLSCVQLLETTCTVAYQAPPSMRFSRQ